MTIRLESDRFGVRTKIDVHDRLLSITLHFRYRPITDHRREGKQTFNVWFSGAKRWSGILRRTAEGIRRMPRSVRSLLEQLIGQYIIAIAILFN